MIANLFFSLIAAGFAAEAAAKARYERLWSFLLLGILALLGFNFWENGQLGVVETFAFHWIDTSLMRVDVNLNTDAAIRLGCSFRPVDGNVCVLQYLL